MVFKRWLISGFLAILAIFFTVRAVAVWTAPPPDTALDVPSKSPLRPAIRPTAARRVPPVQAYRVVAERNLFSADRQSAQAAKAVKTLPSTGSRNAGKITLLGVVIQNEYSLALVRESSHKADDHGRWVRPGDKIDQLQVIAIEPDRIVVQEGQQAYEIRISEHNDANRPRAKSPSAPGKAPASPPLQNPPVTVGKPVTQGGQPLTQDKPQ